MIELRQFVSYFFAVAMAAAILSAGAVYSAWEGLRYIPPESINSQQPNASDEHKRIQLASAESASERRDGPPVWIAATPKYDYDPKLMIIKPREERLKEAALKRKREAAEYVARQRVDKQARDTVAQQRRARQLREVGNAYAYQPEARPTVGIFSLFQ